MGAGISAFANTEARTQYEAIYDEALRDLPPIDQPRFVETAYGRVCCYEFGDHQTTPLTLIAGRNAATPMWAPNVAALAGNRRVICVDAIGEAGMSTQKAPLARSEDHAKWIDETLAGLGVRSTHLVGASLGGWTAMHAALHSDRVRTLTLIDPPSTFAPLRPGFIAAGMLAQSPLVTARRRRRLLAWIAGDADEDSPQARLGIAALLGFRIRQAPPSQFSEEQLRAVHVPVLALIAGRSRVHDPAAAAERAAVLPAGSVETWPDAGHTMSAQFRDRFNERVRDFVDANDAHHPN